MTKQPQRYLKMIGNKPDDWTNFWFDQIGWVGYFFAQLEWASYWLAEEVGSKAQQHEMGSRVFCARAKYASKHLVPKLVDTTLQQDWQSFFKKIMKCAKMRNDILHNPLEVNLGDMQTNGIKVTQGIRLMQAKGRRIIQLGDVQQFTNELRALNVTMLDLMQRTALQP